MLFVYYSGHGSLEKGTSWAYLPVGGGNRRFIEYPLEHRIREFRNKHPSNSFVFGVFDSCQNVTGLADRYPLILIDRPKAPGFDSSSEYNHGTSNLLIVKSSEPTRPTDVRDRVTHALLEYMNTKATKDGGLVLPQALYGFTHLDKVTKEDDCSGSVKLSNAST